MKLDQLRIVAVKLCTSNYPVKANKQAGVIFVSQLTEILLQVQKPMNYPQNLGLQGKERLICLLNGKMNLKVKK